MTTNNLALVVLIHNQAQNLPRLIAAYKGLASPPALFVFVLDRCNDDSKEQLERSGLRSLIVEVNHTSNFMAGWNRDVGLHAAEKQLPGCDVVFLDGDCVPTPELLAAHASSLNVNRNFPTTTIARRVNEDQTGRDLHDDNRIVHARATRRVFGAADRIVLPKAAANNRLLTWSCNLGLNRKMIELCRWVNNQLCQEHDRVFNSAFDGRWGGEDDFVGLTASYFGAAVIALDPKHHVRHIWHVSRQNDAYARTMRLKTGQLKDLAKQTGALGVSRIDTCNALEDVDRCAAADNVELRDPILLKAVAAVGAQGNFELAGLATAMSYPMWIYGKQPKVGGDLRSRWTELRSKLFRLYDLDLEPSILRELTWNFEPASRRVCVICESDRGFAPNGRCRACNSYPWHRLASKFINSFTGHRAVFNADVRAEKLLFDDWDRYSYSGMSGVKADLEKLPIPSEMYDVTYSAHTLEHVKNDRKALAEIHRITKLSGVAVMSVPVDEDGRTIEELGPMTKDERIARFWWHDHWRVYGRDAAQRFADAGFEVELRQAATYGQIDGVAPDETVFVLHKLGVSVKPKFVPRSLYLDVYNSCNYACKHCTIHQIKDNGEIDVGRYKAIIAEFALMGGQDLQFSSGETLLKRSVVLELIAAGKRSGLNCNIVTNGSTVTTAEHAVQLREAGLDAAIISIDSHVAAKHDETRGVLGSFDKAIAAGALLRAAGVKTKASCVLTRLNVADFPTYAERMRALGFDDVSFTLLEPTFALSRFKYDDYYAQNRITDVVELDKALRAAKRFCSFTAGDVERCVKIVSQGVGASDCDSSERNIIVSRDGKVRLCYGKNSVGEYVAPGDLRRIWDSAVAFNRRYEDRHCARACAISDCHRRRTLNS